MIFKLSVLAALVAPLVSALTVNPPSRPVTSGGSMTFTWSVKDGDPATFSVFLSNPSFNKVFGIANSVDASLLTLTLAVPAVPENQQYTIQLVPIDNSEQVLTESAPFTIGATATGTTPTASTTASASTRISSTTRVSLSSPSAPITLISTGGFGTTISNTQVSSAASSATAPANSSPAASASSFSSAALPVRFNMNMGVVASMVLSVFAGAAVVAL